MKTKTCIDCNLTLPITAFRQSTFWTCKQKIKKSVSTRRKCKKCDQAKAKKRYAEDLEYRERRKEHARKFSASLDPEERQKRSKKSYEKNRDKHLQQKREFYAANKELMKKRGRTNYAKHAKKRAQEKREYRKNNPERIALSYQKYYQKNKEKILAKDKIYKRKHRPRYNELARKKYANCIQFKLKSNLHNRINAVIRNNTKSDLSIKLLGTDDLDIVWDHFEKRWFKIYGTKLQKKDFMAGLLHIDHIIPCASFDLSIEKEQHKCFHYTNLQLLYASDNCAKGAKLNWRKAA